MNTLMNIIRSKVKSTISLNSFYIAPTILIIIPFLSYDNCRTIYLFYCVFFLYFWFFPFLFIYFIDQTSIFYFLLFSSQLPDTLMSIEHFFRQKHMYDIIYLYTVYYIPWYIYSILCIFYTFSHDFHTDV